MTFFIELSDILNEAEGDEKDNSGSSVSDSDFDPDDFVADEDDDQNQDGSSGEGDQSGESSDGTGDSATPADFNTNDFASGGAGGDDPNAGDPSATGEPTDDAAMGDPVEDEKEKQKKIAIFDTYRDLSGSCETFLTKVNEYREIIKDDEDKKKNFETIDFIEDSLYKIQDNVKLILTDKIIKMDYEKLKTIFTHIKSEMNLLIKLFKRISNSGQ
jgi:hypothetical protein